MKKRLRLLPVTVPEGFNADRRIIDTLVALNGLQPGDELVLHNTHTWNLDPALRGRIVVVKGAPPWSTVGNKTDRLRVAWVEIGNGRSFLWEICRFHIKAWRRP